MGTEILLNLHTGEVRRNLVTYPEYFRFHANFTKEDMAAGWKQILVCTGFTEAEILNEIKQAKSIYLKPESAQDATALQILPDEVKNQPAKAAPPPFSGVESTGHHQE